jgi:DNA polymerase I-like protein with 3'-5' exonuclease and polymerase domains
LLLYQQYARVGSQTESVVYAVDALQGTRAAINTPIQGSAADIVMLAMIALEDQPRLRELPT